MSVARSPRYPIIGLREAIEKARAVYDSDHQNKIPKEVVAQHMGYGGLNGKSLGVVSAVLKYGLLDGRADQMWVTDRAQVIFEHAADDAERAAAIKAAASEPDLFRELDAAFKTKVSDQSLRAYLVTKRKFLPEAADRAIRSYRETRDLVEAEAGGYDVETSEQEAPSMHAAAESSHRPSAQAPPAGGGSPPQPARQTPPEQGGPPPTVPGTRTAVFALAEGDVVIRFPDGLSPDSVDDLSDYLEIFMKRERREAKARAVAGAEERDDS